MGDKTSKKIIKDENILNILGDLFPKQTMLNRFGNKYINAIQGWYFPDDLIEKAAKTKKLIHLDYEFGINCSLKCWYCFRTDDKRDQGALLSFDKWKDVLRQAKELGVKDIKLLGAGELTEHKRFFEAMEFIAKLGITPVLFTAGHVIGDDNLAKKYHGITGKEMVKRLDQLGVSVMIKVNSFDPAIQDNIVGVPGYSKKRDEGLRRLIKGGLNQYNPTRLGLEVAMMKTKSGELFEIYKLKEALNLYIDLDPFMPCGCTKTTEKSKPFDITLQEKLNLYKKIYKFNLERGIPFRGPSPYAGGQECSQLAYGLYINARGKVFACPAAHKLLGDVRKTSLKEIWETNPTKDKFLGCLSHGCPYRESAGVLYPGWEKNIMERLEK